MCDLVAVRPDSSFDWSLESGHIKEFDGPTLITKFTPGEGVVLQCWHPETREWATMLPPVEGMGWEMTPGSKLRSIPAEDAPAPEPSMVEQVEAVSR